MQKWKYGSETFTVDMMNDDSLAGYAAPVVWTACQPGHGLLVGFGSTPADAIADYKRVKRDRDYANRDTMCSG